MPDYASQRNSDSATGRAPTLQRGARVLVFVLAGLLVASVAFSISGEKPWGRIVQKRIQQHKPLTPKEYAVIGLWWGAVTNAALIAVLLAGAKKWVPGMKAEVTVVNPPSEQTRLRGRKWMLILLAAAVALAAWIRAPRLSHSLWNDEEYAMRKFAHGAWDQQKDGTWQFEPAAWTETLFENRNGNNHVLNSLVTRLALDAWRWVTGVQRFKFSEAALRTPAFIAGLLTIVMIYLLGLRVGGPLTGIGAAFILALCPWHVRYAVEAKGYSYMLLFVCTALYALLRALEENRLRWWLAFALSEAAFILSFAGSAYIAVAINLFAAFELVKTKQRARLWTLGGFNALGAIIVIEWMLPSVPQLLAYLRSDQSLHLGLGWPWLRDFFSGLAIGFQYDNPGGHAGTSWLRETASNAWLAPFMWMAAALFIAGIGFAVIQNKAARLAIAAPTLAVAAAYLQNYFSGTPMVVWYLVYVIIPAAIALPFACTQLTTERQPAAGVFLSVFIIGYAISVSSADEHLRNGPRQPMREAVSFVRSENATALTAVTGVSDKQIASYDPKAVVLDSASDLRALVKSSVTELRPMFIYVCGMNETLKRQPELMSAIESGLRPNPGHEQGDPVATFKLVAQFDGTEEMFSYRVYRAEKAGITKQ